MREKRPAISEPSMIPTPEQASMPWITTVLVTFSASLAKAGKAAVLPVLA